jgi:transcriptional regulator with XRE-family HTH domain
MPDIMSSMNNKKQLKDPVLLRFGKRVKKLRNQKGLSQEKLADRASLHWTYISGIERGLRNISLKNIFKIAKALKVNPKNLLEF